MISKLSNFNPKIKKAINTCIVFAIILLIIGAFYLLPIVYIRTFGLQITPSKDYDIAPVEYYMQNDPEWSESKLGNSKLTIGSHGCLVSSVASAMSYEGFNKNPSQLNDELTAINGFQDADMIWFKLNEIEPKIDYKYSRSFTSTKIENYLSSGELPIVKVRYKGNGIFHWVVIVGAKDGEFYIMDPLDSSKQATPLSNHGKVYAYRVLISEG